MGIRQIYNRLFSIPCAVIRDERWRQLRDELSSLPVFLTRTDVKFVCPHCGSTLHLDWRTDAGFLTTARAVAECPRCSYWIEMRLRLERGLTTYGFGGGAW